MTRFTTQPIEHDGERLVRLCDTATGAFADVWPEFGNNCVQATLPSPLPAGALVDLLLAPDSLAQVREQPSWWGIPLLFPYPSRLPGGIYEHEGRDYRFSPQDPQGSTGHGFVKAAEWHVERAAGGELSAQLVSSFDSQRHPETLDGYPFPYNVEAVYTLDAGGLRLDFHVHNPGAATLPFGYGPHPYFKIPLGPGGSPADCSVHVPAARKWDGQRVAAIREGDTPTYDVLAPRVTDDNDLRAPRLLQQRHFDGVYTELSLTGGSVECYVRDPAHALDAVMQATPNFQNVVVYTPQGRPGVCFEPWTCPPNVFNLAARGVPNVNLIVLPPGETWAGTMWLFLRPSPVA